MSTYQQHTFFYKDEADYVRQLDMELQRLLIARMEDYAIIRARYGFTDQAPAFTMRAQTVLACRGHFPARHRWKRKKDLETSGHTCFAFSAEQMTFRRQNRHK